MMSLAVGDIDKSSDILQHIISNLVKGFSSFALICPFDDSLISVLFVLSGVKLGRSPLPRL